MSNSLQKKWIMYSAHDMTLLAIMNGLNMTNYKCVYDSYFNPNSS